MVQAIVEVKSPRTDSWQDNNCGHLTRGRGRRWRFGIVWWPRANAAKRYAANEEIMLDESDTEKLLDHLCVKLGFCLTSDAKQNLISNSPSDVKSFTDAVFKAEGMNPETSDKHLYRQVAAEVQATFLLAKDEKCS